MPDNPEPDVPEPYGARPDMPEPALPGPDLSKLAGCWVEIREESTPERIVLRPDSADIPPARGRRQIDLIPPAELIVGDPGPTDRTATRSGSWSVDGDQLTLSAPGWDGCYAIAQLREDILVIRRT